MGLPHHLVYFSPGASTPSYLCFTRGFHAILFMFHRGLPHHLIYVSPGASTPSCLCLTTVVSSHFVNLLSGAILFVFNWGLLSCCLCLPDLFRHLNYYLPGGFSHLVIHLFKLCYRHILEFGVPTNIILEEVVSCQTILFRIRSWFAIIK